MDFRTSKKNNYVGLQGIIQSWLASWDFVDDPFGSWEAGREPLLERYFVRRPFYEQLLESPSSTLVFAPRGGGKTATRIMITSECRPAVPTSEVLVVPFTDFSPFVETFTSPQRYSLEDFLPHLLLNALHQLMISASNLPIWGGSFSAEDVSELRFWVEKYAPQYFSKDYLQVLLREIAPKRPSERIAAWAEALYRHGQRASLPRASPKVEGLTELWGRLTVSQSATPILLPSSPSRIMVKFLAFVRRFLSSETTSCRFVFFLVDGVDEYDVTQNDPDAASTILRPLLGNLHFLELPGLAVKFFLPLEQKESLEKVARIDRLETYFLSWEENNAPETEFEGLRALLYRRIRAFNTANIRSLAELCTPALRPWIEEAILEEAAGSPRNLLRLGHQIFVEHCRDIPEPDSVIQRTDWERALRWFRVYLAQAPANVEGQIVSSVSPADERGTKILLRVDLRTGKIYHGSNEFPHDLGDLEFRLLAHLYRRKGHVCSREELMDAVYGVEAAVSPQMLSSLVYRLRQKIEPPEHSEYFVQTVRGRGYRLENAA